MTLNNTISLHTTSLKISLSRPKTHEFTTDVGNLNSKEDFFYKQT